AEAGLRMNDSVPALLSRIRADVTPAEWTLINRLGLSGIRYYSRITRNHGMLQALNEHIVCVRPVGQSLRAGETGVQRLGFRRWVQIEQEERSQAVMGDIVYYRQ
ncbi:hypothetical protein KI387_021450, partial [Taxus chinensis]